MRSNLFRHARTTWKLQSSFFGRGCSGPTTRSHDVWYTSAQSDIKVLGAGKGRCASRTARLNPLRKAVMTVAFSLEEISHATGQPCPKLSSTITEVSIRPDPVEEIDDDGLLMKMFMLRGLHPVQKLTCAPRISTCFFFQEGVKTAARGDAKYCSYSNVYRTHFICKC